MNQCTRLVNTLTTIIAVLTITGALVLALTFLRVARVPGLLVGIGVTIATLLAILVAVIIVCRESGGKRDYEVVVA